MASSGGFASFSQRKEPSTGASILMCTAHEREVCGPCGHDFAKANAWHRKLVRTGGNVPNDFDPSEPIVVGGTNKTSYGHKTVPVLHVGTRLRMANRSGDGRPDLMTRRTMAAR